MKESPVLIGASIAGIAVFVLVLMGCEAKLNVKSTPNKPAVVTVPGPNGLQQVVEISEMCYDGVTYLVTPNGGVAPKVDKATTGPTLGLSPFVKC